MRSHRTAVAWELGRRHRWGWLGIAVYFIELAVIRLAVLLSGRTRFIEEPMTFSFLVTVPLSAAFMYVLAVFSFGLEGDLAGRQSMFPPRRLTLPVTTRELVLWPMLYGSVAVSIVWIGARGLGIWPAVLDAPVVWPVALAVTIVAWVQALTWMPYPVAGLRVIVTVAVLTLIDVVVFTAYELRTPEWIVVVILLPLIPLAYLTACFAVGRARRGEVPDWSAPFRPGRLAGGRRGGTGRFSSPGRAQSWLEWRQVGRSLPVMLAMVLPFELAMFFLFSDTPVIVIETLVCVLFTPPFLALFVASSVSGSSLRLDHRGLDTFLATRPVPGSLLVGAKLKMAVVSTALTWAIVLMATPVALWLSGTLPTIVDIGRRTVDIFGTARATVLAALVLLVLLSATWKQLVQSLCIGMTGRAALIKASVFVPLVLLTIAGPVFVWIGGSRAVIGLLLTSVPWIVASLACMKVAAGMWVATRLSESRLLAGHLLVAGAVLWSTTCLLLHGVLAWIVPAILVPRSFLAFLAILAIPLVRVSASPLALAWNRHR